MNHSLVKEKTVPEEPPYPLEEKPIVIVDEIITSKHDGKTKIAICKHEIRVTEEVIKKGGAESGEENRAKKTETRC